MQKCDLVPWNHDVDMSVRALQHSMERRDRIQTEALASVVADRKREIAKAINEPGGANAVNLRLAEQYITEFGQLAKANNTMIIPSDLANIAGIIKAAGSVIKGG